MSFRIDLGQKDGVGVFLVVVRDQIKINFAPKSDAKTDEAKAYQVRADFGHLLEHFEMDHRSNMVRGEDNEHVKRHHGVQQETNIPHQHISFDRDVNPTMLAEFLAGLIQAQKDHSKDKQYQFFDARTAKDVQHAFTQFYAEFYGSSLQKECLLDCRLTKAEALSLADHATKPMSGTLSATDVSELSSLGLTVNKPTVRTYVQPSMGLALLLNAMFFGTSPNPLASTSVVRHAKKQEDQSSQNGNMGPG